VEEPFHVLHRRTVFAARTPLTFTYVTDSNEEQYLEDLRATIDGHYRWRHTAEAVRRPVDLGVAAKDVARFATRRIRRQRAVLKDPFALFSIPWIQSRFGADVIVMVRHPAAIMWSMKRLGWRFNFSHLVQQPQLMNDLLSPWADEIEKAAATEDLPLTTETALVWRTLYGAIEAQRAEHPDWMVIRHEDLSRNALSGFADVFRHIGESLDERVTRYVEETTSQANPSAAPDGTAHALRRDSAANATGWRSRLDPSDVDELRSLSEDVASVFYTDDDW